MSRRLSYASVAAGTASNTAREEHPPTRSGAFAHLMNPNTPSPGHGQIPEAEQRQQAPGRISPGMPGSMNLPGSWARGNGMTDSPYQTLGEQYLLGGHGKADGLIRPSYLKGSKYMERLEAAHKAKLAAKREADTAIAQFNLNGGSLSASSSSLSLHRMAPSHRGMTYEIVENQPSVDEETVPPLPSKWAEVDRFGGLELSADGQEVRYSGLHKTHEHEYSAARTDHPMPSRCGMYYYEVSIVSKGKEGLIGVGFSGPKVSLERLPGWEPSSWAYHGDDGKSFCCQSTGKAYGPTFTTGDTVGCGVNFVTATAFFTKNGVFQGNAFRDLKDTKLYPSIGMKRPGAQVKVNFGQYPFMFDIDGWVAQEKAIVRNDIRSVNVSSLVPSMTEDALIRELVAQFLRHDGYVETAKAFAEECKKEAVALKSSPSNLLSSSEIQEDIDAVSRQQIRAAILDGDVDKALKRTNAYYPFVLRDNPGIHFRLRCRKFVEMMRQSTEYVPAASVLFHGRKTPINNRTDDVFEQAMELDDPVAPGNENDWDHMETEETNDVRTDEAISADIMHQAKLDEALRYAQELEAQYKDDKSKEVKDTLREIWALFAYGDARGSPAAGLMDRAGRVPVAEELNSAILVSLGKSPSAAIERLAQQTEVLLEEITDQGCPGAFVNLDVDFSRRA